MISFAQVESEEALEAGQREAMVRSLDREVPGLRGVRAEVKRLRSGYNDNVISLTFRVFIKSSHVFISTALTVFGQWP